MTLELTPGILHNQFALSRELRSRLQGWRYRSHGGWALQTHPTLPVIDMQVLDGVFAGWLLGFPIAEEGLLREGSVVRVPAGEDDVKVTCEAYLNGLAGRWLAIVFAFGESRVYLDPCGSLAAVYSVEESVVCSTPSVIGKGPEAEDWDDELVCALSTMWYPFGLTPHRSLRRLLPNHFLDLETWQVARHWPAVADVELTEDTEPVLDRVVELLSGVVAAAVRSGAYMTLTAGFDTRVLLACSRPVAKEATYFTSTGSRMDVQGASELARRLDLRHVLVAERKATEAEKKQRLYLSGYTTDVGSQDLIGNHRLRLQAERLQVTGNCGHLGRDSAVDDRQIQVDANRMLSFLKVPAVPTALAGAAAWLEGLPVCEAHQAKDLAWLEQRIGCKTGPQQYGFDFMSLSTVDGYSHRAANGLMLSLPLAYRLSGAFFRDICRRAWPETLEVPINQPWGGTRLLTYGERARKKLRRALR